MGSEKSADFEGLRVIGADEPLDAELDRSVASSVPLAYAVVLAGDQPGRVYVLHRNTSVIGRVENAEICLTDASVSARHARIINGSRGFEIEDLDSTNGTVIGGQRISRAPLRNGDRVTVGNVDLIFLLERPMTNATVQLQPMRGPASVLPTGATLIRPGGAMPGMPLPPPAIPTHPMPQAPQVPRGPHAARSTSGDDDDSASMQEIIGHVLRLYRYVQAQKWTIVAIICVCAALGVASMLAVPPRTQAVMELKLVPQAKDNPVEQNWRPPDEQQQTYFASPERTFTSSELVGATLLKIEGAPSPDKRVDVIASRLKLEAMGDHLYRASFTEPYIGRGKPPVAQFLSTHTQAYVQKEIDRALREFNAKVTFLRNQMKAVEDDLARISDERTKFRAENADRLPEDALQTHTARFTLESRRADLTAQVRLLEAQLDAARVQLAAGRPLVEAKFKSSQAYRESLAATNKKLSEAYASGLADGHPQVQQLKSEKERLEELIKKELASGNESAIATPESDPAYQAAKSKVEGLEAQVAAARRDLGDTEKSLSQVRNVVGDLPRVEAGVVRLTAEQESTSKLREQLFEKLKQAELQLNLEQVSIQSRYEIGRMRLERPSTKTTLAIRFLIGAFAGLFVAALWLAAREGRRYIAGVMATIDDSSRGV
jgi:uncharacterized protein involved in exopolysaccharide biosynthesis